MRPGHSPHCLPEQSIPGWKKYTRMVPCLSNWTVLERISVALERVEEMLALYKGFLEKYETSN